MKTAMRLILQYEGLVVIPVERVCADYFAPLTVKKFLEMQAAGAIDLPVVRIYGSQKAARGVNIEDLADYLDKRITAARKELEQLRKTG